MATQRDHLQGRQLLSPAPFLFRILWYALPVSLCLACYCNSLGGGLVHDDIFAIRDNHDLRASTPLSKLLSDDFWGEPMSSKTSHKSYRPLTVLTFRLNYMLHGLEPWGYHVVNVCLHVLATLLFGWFCRKEVFWGRWSHCSSLLAMLLFSVHPVHTEAVSGVVGRADLLACILFLLSLLFYCSSTKTSSWSMGAKLFLSILCGAAAMLSKEHGATVLGVCLVYDVLVSNRSTVMRLLQREIPMSSCWPLLLRGCVLALATALMLAVRVSLLHGHLPHFSAQDNPASFAPHFQTRTLSYAHLVYFNLRLLFYPYVLCYDWQMNSIPLVQSLHDPRNVLTGASFLALALLSWSALQGGKWSHAPLGRAPLWGLLLLTIPFLPASNLLLRVGFVVAERILYIPSLGWCVLVATGVEHMCQRWVTWRRPLTVLLVALLLTFSARTVSRNTVWQSREALFRSALATVPTNAKIHFNYANFLKDIGRRQEAVQFYQTAVRLSPDHAVSHNNLGSLLRGEEAELHFREAVRHNPQHYRAYYNLGRNLQDQSRRAEAEEAYRNSLKIKPTYLDPLMSLASLVGEGPGRAEEGWALMERALELQPLNPDVHNNAGAFLLKIGKTKEARSYYEDAIRLAPNHVTALTSLARVSRSLGEDLRAEQLFRRSLSLNPDPSTSLSLASLLHNTGRLHEAELVFREALNLDPNRTDLICGLSQTLLQVNRLATAKDLLEGAIATHPSCGCVHQGLGTLHLHLGNHQEALQYLSHAVELHDSSELKADALHLQGGLLKDIGRLEDAEEAYRAALKLSPAKASTRMNLGAILHLKRDYVSARVEYEAALKLDPHNTIITDNLRKLERAAANVGGASKEL